MVHGVDRRDHEQPKLPLSFYDCIYCLVYECNVTVYILMFSKRIELKTVLCQNKKVVL